ncbi:MAG TPA: ligase-associated DNA damage response endonuclease PdeM [Stellaceae bacterium]|nr:ligase-associated DNA damage response endonuclease PdeM [Stellaceae bacterium]
MDCARPSGHPIELNGARLLAEPSGAVWWQDEGTLIVADLHLDKGSSGAADGAPLPPSNTIAMLERLVQSIRPDLRRVLCLGDGFPDSRGPERPSDPDRARIAALTQSCDWIWLEGSHDPGLPDGRGGRIVMGELAAGPLVFRPIAASAADPGEVSGHYHPKVGVSLRGRRFAGPCFLYDGRRLVLPAFGASAGGLDRGAPELRALFPGRMSVALIARGRVVALPPW